ncbi:MAG: CmcJ/NvfI family oxidoreductase [Kiloniellales bacterium]
MMTAGTRTEQRAPDVPLDATAADVDYVEASLVYLADTRVKPVTYNPPPRTGLPRRDGNYAPFTVRIRDGRAIAGELSLDRQGFVLARHDSAVADLYDDDEVRGVYYPEIERLVKRVTGASKVLIFDHTRRADDGGKPGARAERAPVRLVHNDYTEESGPRRVRDLLDPDEAKERLKNRFAEFNVWQPIAGPVRRSPLALADSRTIAPDDLVKVDLVYEDRTGEIYHGLYNPNHRWYYFPAMTVGEVVLIKCYDSETDGRARFSLHTGFDDPATPVGAPTRESIETRAFAFFGA